MFLCVSLPGLQVEWEVTDTFFGGSWEACKLNLFSTWRKDHENHPVFIDVSCTSIVPQCHPPWCSCPLRTVCDFKDHTSCTQEVSAPPWIILTPVKMARFQYLPMTQEIPRVCNSQKIMFIFHLKLTIWGQSWPQQTEKAAAEQFHPQDFSTYVCSLARILGKANS